MKENKMGVLPINKLIITMSLPIIISMLIQALYNVVDSIFVAQINQDALTAVGLAFPIQNLMIAFATGTGVGINALVARNLGQKNREEASRVANNGVFLGICTCLGFMLIGLLFSHTFFTIQTSDVKVIGYGETYLSYVTLISCGLFLEITFERILQATGRTIYTMITQGSGAIINIILDPILIFGFFGLPEMGVAGAALATVIGQICSGILAFYFNYKINHDIDMSLEHFKPNSRIIKKIYGIGIPSIIMASISSVMTFLFLQILLGFTKTAAAFYTVYIKLQSFIFMPIFGLNNGLVPIISYNYGAQKKERILRTIKIGAIYATLMMIVGLIVFQLFPEQLLHLFKASKAMKEIGVIGLRIISIHFLLAGTSIVLGTSFQALGHGVYSMIVSICRQLIVLIPVAYLLSLTNRLELVWLSYPIAESASLIISIILFIRIYNQQIKLIKSP